MTRADIDANTTSVSAASSSAIAAPRAPARKLCRWLLALSQSPAFSDHVDLLLSMKDDPFFFLTHAQGLRDAIRGDDSSRLSRVLSTPTALLTLYILRGKRDRNEDIPAGGMPLTRAAVRPQPMPERPNRQDWNKVSGQLSASFASQDVHVIEAAATAAQHVACRALDALESLVSVCAIREVLAQMTLKLAHAVNPAADTTNWYYGWATSKSADGVSTTIKTTETICVRTALTAMMEAWDRADPPLFENQRDSLDLHSVAIRYLLNLHMATGNLLHQFPPMIAQWNPHWETILNWSPELLAAIQLYHPRRETDTRSDDGGGSADSGSEADRPDFLRLSYLGAFAMAWSAVFSAHHQFFR